MKSHIKYSSMIRDWYTSGDKQSGDRLRILLSNYNSSIIGYMTGGSFWTGLLIILNSDDAFIGILAMIPALANIIQLFSPLVLERFARRKRMIISLRAVSFILQTVIIGIIPIFPMQSQSKLTILLLVFLLTQAISAFINPGVQSFLLPSYGEGKTRPAFFSFINATNGIISLTLALIAGKVMDILKANGLEYQGLLGLRVIAFLVALFDLYLYSKIKEYPYSDTRERFTIKEMFTLPFAERAYMRSVLACVIYNFSSMFMGNYLSVYLLNDLQIDYSYLNLINFLSIPFSLLFAPVWKKLQWRMGWFKTLSLALIMVPVYYIGIAFTQKNILWPYTFASLFSFMVSAPGISMLLNGIAFYNLPKERQTVYTAFYYTASNVAVVLSTFLGKCFIEWTQGRKVTLFGVSMGNKQCICILTGILVFVGAIIIYFLSVDDEKDRKRIENVKTVV